MGFTEHFVEGRSTSFGDAEAEATDWLMGSVQSEGPRFLRAEDAAKRMGLTLEELRPLVESMALRARREGGQLYVEPAIVAPRR